ncbi:MAG: UTP--glucose-1-phosphate uridylyltransferase [Bacillota bacterium]
MDNCGFSPELAADMRQKGIDLRLTRKILDKYNAGGYAHVEPVKVSGIPEIDGHTILDMTGDVQAFLDPDEAQACLDRIGLGIKAADLGRPEGGRIIFDKPALRKLGVLLYPYVAYGILNGGSASSYIDTRKNNNFNAALMEVCRKEFDLMKKISEDKSKGLTPAYLNQDMTPGPSFIELKMRALLIEILRYQAATGRKETVLPMFQMTSVHNDGEIGRAYRLYRESPILAGLIRATGVDITRVQTGVQHMLAAYSHSEAGKTKTVFDRAYGKENNTLPMPGGHGQNFLILSRIYRDFWRKGYKFAYLGNVDNLGFAVEPVSLGLMALHNKQAAFEFAFRTVVDVKGGILVADQRPKLNCVDIGPGIAKDEVVKAEREGKRVLFNCAVGLFNLEYLVPNLEHIAENLPVRFSDQEKDAGRYSQAEQITWEIMGMMDDFLVFGVDKYDRFLAAKILLESLMTSGIGLENPDYPTDNDREKDLKAAALKLSAGLKNKLRTVYGMKFDGRRWTPKSVEELRAELCSRR